MGLMVSLAVATNLSLKKNKEGYIYWHGTPEQKVVALTFDDGPNEPYTSEILDILHRYDVKATFFMVGKNVAAYPDTARKIVAEGHAIGNHSWDHPNLIFKTNGQTRQEIMKTEYVIKQITGVAPELFRPPYGGEDIFTLAQIHKLGFVTVKWSMSFEDWKMPGVNKILERTSLVKNGSIILLHDGNRQIQGADRSQTVAALPEIILRLKKEGYTFVTVPQLLKIDGAAADCAFPANNTRVAMTHSQHPLGPAY
jgi:peptidoglycan/xylan/chitin deacetylase (PgdA/CDA1 family)